MSGQSTRFGVIQGRLLEAPKGKLQWFPRLNWETEFRIASELKINFIELIAEREHNPQNPLWSNSGLNRILNLVEINGLDLEALCNDYIIDHSLVDNSDAFAQTLQLLNSAKVLGCKKLILPLFEKSELTSQNSEKYFDILLQLGVIAQSLGIIICLETSMNGSKLCDYLDMLNHPSICSVYDTGNSLGLGHDIYSDIRILGSKIKHVHLKDKNQNNENVLLGLGLVNFFEVFSALGDVKYSGPYTFETSRGENPVRTANHNINFANFFIDEASA